MKYNLSDPIEAARFQIHIYDLANKRAKINKIYYLGDSSQYSQYLKVIFDMIERGNVLSVDDSDIDNVTVFESNSTEDNTVETIKSEQDKTCANNGQLVLPLFEALS